ncbi:MAG: ammonia channel protein [Dehalococcoidia bacterium]|nr:ammonia channel protein [Dehalococcoidia bacterium]|tara:strand:- start:2990 stop:4234 length:1245 start_codon:yes stop_codon:yes gene_type:complete
MDSGHVAWILTASALVLLMTPGLAFFYGGLVRARNSVSTIMYSFISMAVVSIVWVLWGYSLAFGTGNAFIGDLEHFALAGIAIDDLYPDTGIPMLLFVVFQMMFAIITPALITGAFVERFRFTTYIVFLVIWITIVYAPVAHWVWGGGWLAGPNALIPDGKGALDFAGGTVVHINAGIAAVAAAIFVGKRKDAGEVPHNVPYVVLGAALLWFGWFGFNAGSGLAANALAVNAFLVTNIAAAAAALTWGLIAQFQTGRMGAVGVASGAVAGLVAITPASGFVDVKGALAIGIGAGGLCYVAVYFRHKTGIDDALEVFAVHGVGGIWGAIATGIFAVAAVGGTAGVIYDGGEIRQLLSQVIAVLATIVYSFVATVIILKILDMVPGLGLRVSVEEEDAGLDLSQHGERAFVRDGAD